MPKGQIPEWRVLSVIFETVTQAAEARFSIPQDICKLLGVDPEIHRKLKLSIQGQDVQSDNG